MQNVTAGANPISVKKGIDKTCDYLVGKLKELSTPVKGSADIKVTVLPPPPPCSLTFILLFGSSFHSRACPALVLVHEKTVTPALR